MSLQPRHKWMAEIAAGCFEREPSQIEDVMREHANLKRLNDFLEGKSKHHHIFLFDQKADVINESGEAIDGHGESKVLWAANKRFEVSKFKFKFPRARTFELYRARSRLYRSQILQVNTRWKALAEIYTMHSFAPFSNLNFFVKNC